METGCAYWLAVSIATGKSARISDNLAEKIPPASLAVTVFPVNVF
jgi:hypothetical protein